MNVTRSNSSEATTLPVTQAELWMQNLVFYVILDVPAFFGNLIIVFLICRHKHLHSFFFVLVAGQALGRAVFSMEFVMVGAVRILRQYYPSYLLTTSRIACLSFHWLIYFYDGYNTAVLFVLAVDRTVSVAAPLRYRKLSAAQGVKANVLLAATVALSRSVPAYLGGTNFDETIICVNFLSPVPLYFSVYSAALSLAFGVGGLTLYSALYLLIRIRTKRLRNATDDNERFAEQLVRKNVKLLPLLTALIVVNFFCIVAMEILIALASFFPPEFATRLVLYSGNLATLDRLLDIFILLWKSSEIRKAFRLSFGSFTSKVNDTAVPIVTRT